MTNLNLEAPSQFITIAWDIDEQLWTLDLGSVNHWEARGVLSACLKELSDRDPQIAVRFNGEDWDSPTDEEEDASDE